MQAMQMIMERRRLIQMALACSLAAAPVRAHATATNATPSPQPALDVFARTPLVEHIALSPNGKRVAFSTTTTNGQSKLAFFSARDLNTSSVGLGEMKIRGLMWTDDDHILVMSSVTERIRALNTFRQEYSRGLVVDTRTLKAVQLFGGSKDFLDFLVTTPVRLKAADGSYRILASAYVNTFAAFGIFLPVMRTFSADGQPAATQQDETHIEFTTDEQAALADLGMFLQSVMQPDGTTAASMWVKLHADYDKDTKAFEKDLEESNVRFIWQVTVKTDSKRVPQVIYTTETRGEWLEIIGLGSHKRALLTKTTNQSGGESYAELSMDGKMGPDIPARTTAGEVSPLFHPETELFTGFAYSDDWVTYEYRDPLMRKLTDGLKTMFPGDRMSIAAFANDPRILIAYCENAETAGAYYHVDFSTGETVELPPNYPDLPADWVAHKRPMVFKARDGLDIPGYLTLPPHREHQKLPLIILPHGGPQARDFGGFDWQAQAFASRGYAVLQPNFRGSSGYGQAFHEAAYGEWGRKMQTDLIDGIQHLAEKGTVDPSRVAIVGASYGGYAALAGATLDTNIYRCAVAIAGISDPESFLNFRAKESSTGKNGWVVQYWRELMGDAKSYKDISPLKQVQSAYCPILLIHGEDDTIVEHKQSQQMAKALQRWKKPYELITYKQQDHWETQESARIDMIHQIMRFMTLHNPA